MIGHAWSVVALSSSMDSTATHVALPASFVIRNMSDQLQASLLAFDIVTQWYRVDPPKREEIIYRVTKPGDGKLDTMFEVELPIEMSSPLHRTRYHVEHMPVAASGLYFLEVYEKSTLKQMAHVPFVVEVVYYGIDSSHEDGFQIDIVSTEKLKANPARNPPIIKGERVLPFRPGIGFGDGGDGDGESE